MGLFSSSKSKSSSKFADNKVFGAEDGTTLGSHAVMFAPVAGPNVDNNRFSFSVKELTLGAITLAVGFGLSRFMSKKGA